MSDVTKALLKLRPGAKWTVDGNSYAGITWLDDSQTKPSEEEINAELGLQQVEIASTEYQRQRVVEYPPIEEYIDGVVKGDQAQIQAYIDTCLMIKRKYPKP